MGSEGHPEDESPDGPASQTQGSFSSSHFAVGGSGHIPDQSNPARLGELFSDWQLQPMLWLYQVLGGEEDSQTLDACSETARFRLGQVE
jgi:hypothetical protein